MPSASATNNLLDDYRRELKRPELTLAEVEVLEAGIAVLAELVLDEVT